MKKALAILISLIITVPALYAADTIASDAELKALSEQAASAQKDTSKYELLIRLGDAYREKGQFEGAIESYKHAYGLLPKLESARMKLAAVYEQVELFDQAEKEYLAILARNSKSVEANVRLAYLYEQKGFNSAALDHYRRALAIQPQGSLYVNLARCAFKAGECELAINMLCQGASEGSCAEDLILLGRLYEQVQKTREAEEAFSKAIKADPNAVEAYIRLGILYTNSGQFKPAEKLFQIALEKSTQKALAHFFLGYLYFKQNNLELAGREFLQARTLSASSLLRSYCDRLGDFITK